MDQKATVKAYSAAIVFSVLVGFSFLGVKICVPLANSLQILTYRYDFAFLALILVLLSRIEKVNVRGKPKKRLFLTAGFYIGFMALQVIGLAFATSIEGAIVYAMIPIFVKVIASLFLGETSTILQNIFVGVTVTALIVMIILGSTEIHINVGGTIVLILSSLSMAISNVFMRYVRNEYKPIEISTAIILMGTLAFNLATVGYGLFTGTLGGYFAPLKDPKFVIATAYLGVGCILFSSQLISYMLSKLPAVNATIFNNVSTAISIVAGVVVLGETLLPYHIICTALIIAGVLGLSFSGRRRL